MDISGNLASEERRSWIRQQLDSDGSVRITTSAKELGVSEMTVRRDLDELEAMGLARRVRGGAVGVGPVAFEDRHRHQAHAKSAIASKLLSMVPSNGAVAFDASSTLLRLATALDGARDLTIVTNGLETFQALQGKPGIRAVLTGGELISTGSLVGPAACRSAGNFLFDRVFVSSAGIDTHYGSGEATLEEAEVKRVLADCARDVVLAVDETKIDSRGVASAIEWSRVMVLVTEFEPHDSRLDAYRAVVTIA